MHLSAAVRAISPGDLVLFDHGARKPSALAVVTEPMFRSAFKRNRCIIPASGYFEWKTRSDGKQPSTAFSK